MTILPRSILVAIAATVSLAFIPTQVHADPFELLVTQTPIGPGNSNPATWGGVSAYSFTGVGASPVAETGIPAASLSDPAGLAYENGILYVNNRNGNNGPSSVINSFVHPLFGGFTPSTTISGNSLNGGHQINVSPLTGELFAASVNGPISRFNISGPTATPNGTFSTGAARGVVVSPDGSHLYYTTASNTIHIVDLTTDTETGSFTVPGASQLHYLRFRTSGELYAADFNNSASNIFALNVASNGALSSNFAFASPFAISLAFSPDNSEMFVAGHNSGIISEYNFTGSSWSPAGSFIAGTSLGDIIILPTSVPEPTTLTLLATSSLLLLRRKN